jgi:hypothetical protein
MTFRFEDGVLNNVISIYLEECEKYSRIGKRGQRLTINKDKFSPPYRSISIDFFGESEDKSHYLLLEIKQKSDPPNIMMALGEALMYRHFIKTRTVQMSDICSSFDEKKDIRLGLCFPDFSNYRDRCDNDPDEFKYQSWSCDTTSFLENIVKNLKEENLIQVYVTKCKETPDIKSHRCFEHDENIQFLFAEPLKEGHFTAS